VATTRRARAQRPSEATPSSFVIRIRITADLTLWSAEVPFELKILSLSVADYSLAVAPELGIVRRQQLQTGVSPSTKVVNHSLLAEDALNVPMRRYRAEVNNPNPGRRG
jgi:hypothetical protein